MQIFGSTGNLLWSTRAKPEISPSREQDNPPKILFSRTENRTIHPKFSRNCFQIISFSLSISISTFTFPEPRTGQSTQNSLFQKLFLNYFLFTIRTETCHVSCFDCNADTYCNTFQEEGGDTNTTDKIETQLQITKILFEIPDGQPLSWGHRQPLPTGANSSPASPVKLVLKNALLGVVDLDGLGWIWMDLDGLGWT